jgi:hypothetical protein
MITAVTTVSWFSGFRRYICYYGAHCYIYFVVSMVTVLRSLLLFPWSLLLPLLLTATSVHCMLSLRNYATRVSPCRGSIHFKYNIFHICALHGYFNIRPSSTQLHRKYRVHINYIKQYDVIYLLTAIGLTPGGSSTVHIYTQTIHRTIQNNT